MTTLAEAVTALSAISSLAVILGAGFVVIQLRQNASILNATLRQEKKTAAFSMLERLTSEEFANRRANFYKVIERLKSGDWRGFDDSPDDFEVRNFAYLYELYGTMVKEGMIDFGTVVNMLQYMVINDWKEFQPLSKHYQDRFKNYNWWKQFGWLATETEKYMVKRDGNPTHAAP